MFENCFNLPKINIDYFDLTKTVSAVYMFKGCYLLKEISLKNEDSKDSSSISLKSAFSNCYSLKSINLKNFKRKSINKIDFMFNNCNSLESIDLNIESIMQSKLFKNYREDLFDTHLFNCFKL